MNPSIGLVPLFLINPLEAYVSLVLTLTALTRPFLFNYYYLVILKKNYLFILAALGLHCGTQALCCGAWTSLLAARGLLYLRLLGFSSCGTGL